MTNPVFDALKRGERFPVSLLVNEYDALQQFWNWWWEQADLKTLSRPYTVADGDPWLVPTMDKPFVDTETYAEYLSEFSLRLQELNGLRRGCKVPRKDYGSDLITHTVQKGTILETPTVVLTGGGYGSGKTTAIDLMMRARRLPIKMGSLTGVDFFKAYLPEFSLLQRLADGNASTVVQKESRYLANAVFHEMLAKKLSFGWDSSMSEKDESMVRIQAAKEKGYKLVLVAVFAPLDLAIRQAMSRARQSRRFAHPEFLPKSHTQFKANFMGYVEHFDEVLVFVNEGVSISGKPNMHFIAHKNAPNRELAIHDRERFAKFAV